MYADLLLVMAGFVLLFLGADRLIDGSVRLSLRLGVAPLIIGLTVVAFGTSTPELFVSIRANLAGSGDIAIGNLVGSNIFNISAILGLSALVCPIKVKSQLIKQDIPVLIGVSALFFVMARDLSLLRWEAGLLVGLLLVYILLNVRIAIRGRETELAKEFEQHMPSTPGPPGWHILKIVIGIAMLVLGSNLLVRGAVNMALASGVSEAVIALTLIAAGTGLPELATSMVAALKKEPDLAVGNIVGSNIFNLLCIGGISPLVRPVFFPNLELLDLAVMMILAVLLLPIAWSGYRMGRREGLLLLSIYGMYLYFIWPYSS